MLRFSESVSFDHRLAPFDIAGSKAHSAMLAKVGLINRKERDAIHRGLDGILREVRALALNLDRQLVRRRNDHDLRRLSLRVEPPRFGNRKPLLRWSPIGNVIQGR